MRSFIYKEDKTQTAYTFFFQRIETYFDLKGTNSENLWMYPLEAILMRSV